MGLPSNTNALQNGFAQGYQIGRSLRFRSSASAYLNRTNVASPTNANKWTMSWWMKRGNSGSSYVFSATNSGNDDAYMQFNNDKFTIGSYQGAGTDYGITTVAVFRDYSAWYHIVCVYDPSNATSADRAIIYINGVRQTVTNQSNGMFPLNYTGNKFNLGSQGVRCALRNVFNDNQFDGYLAEVNFIDGQALTPSSFGLYDSNGIWQPKKYTGTYGANGFYLPFSNTTSTTTLVADASGNGNNWTANNISLTAGTTYDSMIDSPTNSNAYGNYCVLNPLSIYVSLASGLVLSDANLQFASYYGGSSYGSSTGTIGFSSGKWYWEVTLLSSNQVVFGISSVAYYPQAFIGSDANGWSYISNTGNKYNNNVGSAYGASATVGDVIGVAMDADTGTLTFYKNGSSLGVAFSGLASQTYWPAVSNYYSTKQSINFGQQPFSYTPPSGYNALNTANLPQPLISNGANYMAATLYSGDGTNGRSISNGLNNPIGVTFQPDLSWLKQRNGTFDHRLDNSIVTGYRLVSNSTAAEASNFGAFSLTSTGISVSASINDNNSGSNYVAWQWKAGGSSSSNTSGSITSTVSVSAQSGFSVVTYTGNGTAGSTVGHSLGVAPSMIIVKARNDAQNWTVYHSSWGNGGGGVLNLTNAFQNQSGWWNNTTPSSTVFTLGGSTGTDWFNTNKSGNTYVAYCFAAVRNYSAMGSYVGNASSDGPFNYCGFRPRWLMVKSSTTAHSWEIYDTSRDPYNVAIAEIDANSSAAEYTAKGASLDFLSNGFKVRYGSSGFLNASGQTYVWVAFAESPFQIARAR